MAQGVSTYVKRNSANPFDARTSNHSPSPRGSSQTRPPVDSASLSQAERQRRAANARVPVLAGHAMHLKLEPDTDMQGLATNLATRPTSSTSNRGPQSRNVFDDTDLDDTISSGPSTFGEDRYFAPVATKYNPPSSGFLNTFDAQHRTYEKGAYSIENPRLAPENHSFGNWQEVVRIEKELQARSSGPCSVVDDFDIGGEVGLYHGHEYDDQDGMNSPGRAAKDELQEQQIHTGNEQDRRAPGAPEPVPARTPSNSMPPPPPPPQHKVTSTFTTASLPSSKSSSYVKGSEDETAPSKPAGKRARIELDYDPETLKTMSYADLEREPFESDPRAANTTPPLDEHGIGLTLHRRLGNLPRMKEEDVRAMFSNQKDQEWEDTGAWFISQFGTQMKRLMEIRQERRMIALEFELEVKRRQATVSAKTSDVEQELRYLKTGGRDLMDKKILPPK